MHRNGWAARDGRMNGLWGGASDGFFSLFILSFLIFIPIPLPSQFQFTPANHSTDQPNQPARKRDTDMRLDWWEEEAGSGSLVCDPGAAVAAVSLLPPPPPWPSRDGRGC